MTDATPDLDFIRIEPLHSLGDWRRIEADLDAIFFSSSNTQSFASPEARAKFRATWLGRYLENDAAHAFVAIAGDEVIGYLVGALDDPGLSPRFADLPSSAAFAGVTRDLPAHLHINVAAPYRSLGVGAALITAFLDHVRASGCPGVTLVTGQGARNVRFYERMGFRELANATFGEHRVVLLGRAV